MVRVELPAHLRTLAGVSLEVAIEVRPPVTPRAVLDALEASYPMLAGTMRDHVTGKRRPFVRFFACGADVSLLSADTELPADIVSGREPFLVIGAIAGG
jgi:molybdopterin converting factor small subunit